MAELSEALIAKLEALAASMQDVKQQVQQSAQDSAQAVQAAKQTAQEIAQLRGASQSDLVSRFLSKDDVDQGDDEARRADQALGFGGRVFKHNVFDFAKATQLNQLDADLRAKEKELQAITVKIMNTGADHYATILADERTSKANLGYYGKAKIQQEQRHADIAAEDQWESDKEVIIASVLAELSKSTQVPKAATEK